MPKTYSKKVKGLDLTKYTEVEIYEMVLNGTLNRFPKEFWTCDDVTLYAPKITKYLLEEKLKWTKEDIKEKLTLNTFISNKLRGFIRIVYNASPYKAIKDAYGEDYLKPWELISTPLDFWQGEEGQKNAEKATRWLFEEKLKWNEEDIKNKLNAEIFAYYGLKTMLKECYNNSIFECINTIYPDRFMPWEVGGRVPNNFWNEETSKIAMHWLVENKLNWTLEDIKNNLTLQTFKDNNLMGLLFYFSNSPFQAIDSIYPNKFKPWEIGIHVPNNYWNEETSKIAMRCLVENKLKWDLDDIKNNLTVQTFKDNDLMGLFRYFNNSSFKAIDSIYPNKIKPWELKQTPNGYWNDKTSKDAVNWLVCEKLKWSKEKAKKELRKKILIENGLSSITKIFSMQEIKDLID